MRGGEGRGGEVGVRGTAGQRRGGGMQFGHSQAGKYSGEGKRKGAVFMRCCLIERFERGGGGEKQITRRSLMEAV